MARRQIKHIAIAGNIGAGKTTLTSLLGRHFNWEVHFEDTETNPYLSDFYDDMNRWSFNLQIYFFKTMSSQVNAPDLLIYLQAGIPTLVSHIQNRGRDYEGSISLDYLKKLNQRYDDWIKNYQEGPLLIVNADEINFIENPQDLSKIIEMVDAEINGLFS